MKGDTEVLLIGLSMRFKGILFFLKELKCFILHKRKKSTVSGEGVSEKVDSAIGPCFDQQEEYVKSSLCRSFRLAMDRDCEKLQ